MVLEDIIFFLFQFGSLSWMEASFTPHLSPYLSTYNLLEDLGENQELTMHLYFFHCTDGMLKNICLIKLGSTFSKKLMREILEIIIKLFDESDYHIKLAAIYNKYSRKELLKFSKERYQI